jgi:hypothetical protein
LRDQRLKELAVLEQKIQRQLCVRWIVLGTAGRERLAMVGELRRIDGIDYKEVIFFAAP